MNKLALIGWVFIQNRAKKLRSTDAHFYELNSSVLTTMTSNKLNKQHNILLLIIEDKHNCFSFMNN